MPDTFNEMFEMMMQDPDNAPVRLCYTVNDLVKILGVNRKTVYKLLKRHEFSWRKVGKHYRISRASFNDWLMYRNA